MDPFVDGGIFSDYEALARFIQLDISDSCLKTAYNSSRFSTGVSLMMRACIRIVVNFIHIIKTFCLCLEFGEIIYSHEPP